MKRDSLFQKRERDGMHFHSRRSSRKGIIGFCCAIFGIILFLVLCVVSAFAKGNAGTVVGVGGLCTMFLCGAAFVLSLQGLKERDVYIKLPFAGLVISGILFILLFCLYITGIQF